MQNQAAKYGENPKQRKINGKKLKDFRLKLGLSAREAAELLGLKNPPAIVNSEIGCSSDLYAKRLEQYVKLEKNLVRPTISKTSTYKGQESFKPGPWSRDDSGIKKHENGANNKHTVLLMIAVRRLAQLEHITEAEVWLHLFDELTESDLAAHRAPN
ncbi:MAG TPA: hypothetical protein V6C89_15110 [Drouetiella sp.]